jgi:hypothetical protein
MRLPRFCQGWGEEEKDYSSAFWALFYGIKPGATSDMLAGLWGACSLGVGEEGWLYL